jgi:hypothetical protein
MTLSAWAQSILNTFSTHTSPGALWSTSPIAPLIDKGLASGYAMHPHKLKQFVSVVVYMQFVGSILQPRDIVMYLLIKMGQSLVSLYSRVMWSPLYRHFQHNWKICLGFTMLTTMCLQFSAFTIYHPYECHLRGRAIMPFLFFLGHPLILGNLLVTRLFMKIMVSFHVVEMRPFKG